MNRNIATEGGYNTAIINDNLIMTRPAPSRLMRIVRAPFTRRSYAEACYMLATLPVALAGVVYTAVTMEQGVLWALSASGMRRLAAVNRFFARELLGDVIAAPPGLESELV